MTPKNQQAQRLFRILAAATACLALTAGVALLAALAQPQAGLAANVNIDQFSRSIDSPNNTNTPGFTNTRTVTRTPTVTRTATPPCGVISYASTEMPLNIPDGGSVTSVITVTDNTYTAYIELTSLYFYHERPEDIDLFLYSPWGHRYPVFTDVCGRDPWTYLNTGFTMVDHSANLINSSCPPYIDSFRSEGSLAAHGAYSQGLWTLEIVDDTVNGYGGLLGDWGLRIASMACPSPTSPPQYTPTNTNTPTLTPSSTSMPTEPTETLTPSPTVEALLVGHITWQGRPAQPHNLQQLPVTLTLKLGSNESNFSNLATNAGGFFTATVSGLVDGIYNWRVKSPKYLAASGAVGIVGDANVTMDVGLMRAGDCNNDNLVTIVDFGIIKTTFGTQIGYPNYDDRADFTGDQIIGVLDFNLIKINFGTSGSPPISPR